MSYVKRGAAWNPQVENLELKIFRIFQSEIWDKMTT